MAEIERGWDFGDGSFDLVKIWQKFGRILVGFRGEKMGFLEEKDHNFEAGEQSIRSSAAT